MPTQFVCPNDADCTSVCPTVCNITLLMLLGPSIGVDTLGGLRVGRVIAHFVCPNDADCTGVCSTVCVITLSIPRVGTLMEGGMLSQFECLNDASQVFFCYDNNKNVRPILNGWSISCL